jgi:hypothetical protein
MRRLSGEKLPSKIALVSVCVKIEASERSDESGHVGGGGAVEMLHQSRNEKGRAGSLCRGGGGATLV